VIKSFRCTDTENIFKRLPGRRFRSIQQVALRKLRMLDSAVDVLDLRNPPGNRLEALSGNQQGQYSIRINDQWRICFIWRDGNSHQVEIVDYH